LFISPAGRLPGLMSFTPVSQFLPLLSPLLSSPASGPNLPLSA
jgi:hypothetical protein